MSESYGPRERIRKKKDFADLYRNGGCYRGPDFHLIFRPSPTGYARMSAVASRKVGNAVDRSRARRRVRELFRRNKELLSEPLDMLMIAKKSLLETAWPGLVEEYGAALRYAARRRSGSGSTA